MRKTIAAVFIVAALCVAANDQPRHLADAEKIVAGISADKNAYQHKGCFIKWKGEDGAIDYENHTDCSDFLALLLEHSYNVTPQQLKKWTGHTRPLADHWHDAIAAESGFTRIKKLTDALPGDVLAVKFPPGLGDTGHVMVVCAPAEKIEAKTPIEPDTQQWNVTIIDSSKSGHGPTDTRHKPDGTFNQGVGKGVLRVYTSSDGTIAGYCWSDGSRSKFEPQGERNMVIGRLSGVGVPPA